VTEREYAEQKARFTRTTDAILEEEKRTLAKVERAKERFILDVKKRLQAIQEAEEALDSQWLAIQETNTRCARCGDRESSHLPTDPEYNLHVYLFDGHAFERYRPIETPSATTQRMRRSQSRERAKAAFWRQNGVSGLTKKDS
jgi:hypothetical protein